MTENEEPTATADNGIKVHIEVPAGTQLPDDLRGALEHASNLLHTQGLDESDDPDCSVKASCSWYNVCLGRA